MTNNQKYSCFGLIVFVIFLLIWLWVGRNNGDDSLIGDYYEGEAESQIVSGNQDACSDFEPYFSGTTTCVDQNGETSIIPQYNLHIVVDTGTGSVVFENFEGRGERIVGQLLPGSCGLLPSLPNEEIRIVSGGFTSNGELNLAYTVGEKNCEARFVQR